MSNASEPTAVQTSKTPCCLAHELGHLQAHWWWFTLYGVLLILCGAVAIGFPVVTSLAVVAVLSVILFIAGIATIVSAFWAGKWSGMLVNLLVGMLYLGAGMVAVNDKLVTVEVITLYLAILFMVVGAFRSISALVVHYPQWGWSLLNGAITFLLGMVIFRQWPLKSFWVIGLLVGIEMLFCGWTWFMLSLAIRNLPEEKCA